MNGNYTLDLRKDFPLDNFEITALQAFGLTPKADVPAGYTDDIPATYGDLNDTQRQALAYLFAANTAPKLDYSPILEAESYDQLQRSGKLQELEDKGYFSNSYDLYQLFRVTNGSPSEADLRSMAHGALFSKAYSRMQQAPEQPLSDADVDGLQWWGLVPQ